MPSPQVSENILKLSTGASIPQIGLGTWRSVGTNDAYHSVIAALKNGYRHIDTAAIYGNEAQVGKAIRDSGVPRNEIFVTSKLWCAQTHDPKLALNQTLKRLGLDYIDLYLMHWPVTFNPRSIKDEDGSGDAFMTIPTDSNGNVDVEMDTWNFIKTWELMQHLPESGKTKAVGVSNFSINNLNDLLAASTTKVVPAANQIELHPLLAQNELLQYCKEKNILVEAYSPFGSINAPILKDETINAIAKKLDIQVGQVVMSWHIQRGGYVVLPKSVHEERIIANRKVVTLPDEDFQAINNLVKEKGELRVVDPDWSPFPLFK
ncbi:uncharacterized protein NDAI_0B05670 [Naumovozyma dairenensis CBS 421]|uniref:NADP-dependent oxidoreductase domain-containing protein n=1 Tax=Naumovozyma dairenensis (strain ATCC 10597 / BCRC 20456 / CBS 421 / NBRC 0211 / NRRL Y-12639) TaxID=1071378 RepID=G0W739_NAUDC|nr:hypothetical protein NDAI_0B05670 [Naumovozyma dairenensis CBS 421]CCD23600.1 hypothetical protein NDAI_0B05670 [Naumovozyma dairenensis CBS 421]